jgi:hypothetical protein
MTHRFFRADEATYETVRSTLDAAWGLPNALGTQTCIAPASVATRDTQGRVLVAVPVAFTTFTVADEMLPQLLAGGAIDEITETEYRSVVDQV